MFALSLVPSMLGPFATFFRFGLDANAMMQLSNETTGANGCCFGFFGRE